MKYSDEWGEKSPEPGEQREELDFQSKSSGWEGKKDDWGLDGLNIDNTNSSYSLSTCWGRGIVLPRVLHALAHLIFTIAILIAQTQTQTVHA